MKRGDIWDIDFPGVGSHPGLILTNDVLLARLGSLTENRPASTRSSVGQGALRRGPDEMSDTTDTFRPDAITKHQQLDPPGTSDGSVHTPGLGASFANSGAARANSGQPVARTTRLGASLTGECQARESHDFSRAEEVN